MKERDSYPGRWRGPRWARRQERRFGWPLRNSRCPATRARRRNARGTALIEFALVLPFLMVMSLAVVDISRAFFVKNMLHQAAREGVRQLVVSAAGDTMDVRTRVNEVLGAAKVPVTKLTLMGPSDGMMTVGVETQFKWMFPGLFRWLGRENNDSGADFMNSVTLKGVAVMRKEGP